ncbi:MAG: RidA family protein [Acidobacteriaceae bacterium]|nr:RidA family protein [Acidobacteriaceae bacterium]
MPRHRIVPALLILLLSLVLPVSADKKKKNTDEEGMIPEVSTKPQKKKKEDEMTQTLPPPKEPPAAVVAETDRLFFQVSPLSSKGLLSQQTRDAMRTLLRSSHGTNIVKLRAFVAGSGDMRRIQEIAGEVFGEKHLALPAISVVQAGALPMEGAQVVIESIGVDRRTINPNGVAFVSGQATDSIEQSLDRLKLALQAGGMESQDVLRVTCFVSSLEASRSGRSALDSIFPSAAINVVQMQRLPVKPGSECEGVARLRSAPANAVEFVNPNGLDRSPNYTQLTLVRAPKVVFSGTQLGFGSQDADIKLAFERLQRAIGGVNAKLDKLAMSHVYVTSMAIADRIRQIRKNFYNAGNPPASTMLPFEGLPSLDASFGVDVVAIPEAANAN